MAGQQGPGDAIAESFLEICQELGCQPLESLLTCLQEHDTVARVTSVQDNEQLYAVATILPFANLQELDLSGLQLDGEQWCALLEAISRCTGLRVLSIKGCNIGALGVDAEEQVARQLGSCRMSVLDASQNQLGDSFIACISSSPLLVESDVLTVLDLSENAIRDNGAAALAATMAAAGLHSPLKQLDLSFNQLGDRAARALASMMAAVPLLALELEGNQISDIGGLAIGDALKQTLCLQRLNLNHNHLTGSTLASIADALNVNPGSLQELAVAGSCGSEQGMAALLTAACKSRHLHLLDVRGLQLAGKAVDALCQLLGSSCPLVTLRVDVASRDAAETIAAAIQGKHTLTHIMMGGNVPEHVLSFVAAALSANTLHKVQAASRSSSPVPVSPRQQQQQRSRTPTQLTVQHQQLMQTPPAATRSAGMPVSGRYDSLQRPFSGNGPAEMSVPRSLSPNYSQHSHTSDFGNTTPQSRVLTFTSPSSAGRALVGSGSIQYRSPGSSGRGNLRTLSMQARRASVIDNQGLGGLAGGGAANKAAEVFRRHDLDGSGYLDAEEMMSALQELGMLEGMRPRQLGKFLSDAIKEADTDRDGRVSIEEFTKYYERLARHYAEASRQGRIVARRRAPEVPLDAPSDEALKRSFRTYCRLPIGQGRQVGGSVQQINAAQFNQLCRDAGLVEPIGPLSQCAIDIIFTRCKPPGSRRLPFKHFLGAVAAVADEAGVSFTAIAAAMSSMEGSCLQPPLGTAAAAAAAAGSSASGTPGTISRRHSIGACVHTRLSISDLTDTRVGPALPSRSSTPPRVHTPLTSMMGAGGAGHQRPSSAAAELGGGGGSGSGSAAPHHWNVKLRATGASGVSTGIVGAGAGAGAGAAASVGAGGGGSGGGGEGGGGSAWGPHPASPGWTPRSDSHTVSSFAGDAASSMLSTPRAEVLLQQARERRATEQQQQQQQQGQQQDGQQQQQQPHGQQEREGSGGGRAATGRQQQQSRGGVFGLADRDAVHNPLFEGEGDGSGGGSVAGREARSSICHRLLALERKILQRASVGSAGGTVGTAGGAPLTPTGGLDQRVSGLEATVEETRQQLSAVLSQQDELKGLLARLLEGLEATGGNTHRGEGSGGGGGDGGTLKAISKSVDTLTAEVASLKEQRAPQPSGATAGMQEQLNQMALSMDKRHTRVETAIYQVAHQVDLLDARVKQEQQSTLRTLQALFTANGASVHDAAAAALAANSSGGAV